MKGCHNCEKRPSPGELYEKTACASCELKTDNPIGSYHPEDPASFDDILKTSDYPDHSHGADEIEPFDTLAAVLKCFLELSLRHPATWQICTQKILHPDLSYRELADLLHCKKQNVMYHLRRAVGFYPALKSALIIDSRFNRGYTIITR